MPQDQSDNHQFFILGINLILALSVLLLTAIPISDSSFRSILYIFLSLMGGIYMGISSLFILYLINDILHALFVAAIWNLPMILFYIFVSIQNSIKREERAPSLDTTKIQKLEKQRKTIQIVCISVSALYIVVSLTLRSTRFGGEIEKKIRRPRMTGLNVSSQILT